MRRQALAILMLLTTGAAPAVWAQGTPASAASAQANAVDPDAVQALHTMGSYLQSLKRFRVSTDLTGERVLADGQKLQHGAQATLEVDRPEHLRAIMRSARSEREIIYDGKTATLYAPEQKYYASVPFKGTLADLIKDLRSRYGVELPLADLFTWGTPDAQNRQFDSAMFAGQDYVGNDLCDHYAYRQAGIDWQIWITSGDKPLPRKIVVTRTDDDARPQSVSVLSWKPGTSITPSTFQFRPPPGAKKIEALKLPASKG
ncbi:hypothetical protein AT302_11935 [Pandoraea norimbergensis]|uniref:DUF2092 domain-containing protein n=2 Tax=Pandoraea norimbergensis TaxID=93219 RepID=A0ABM5WJ50_9BURK|nr:hypothetical protein AT302_11935 [Pandoraea norimbergensis]